MSRLRAWHIMVPALILVVGAPAVIYFWKIRPMSEQIQTLRTEIEQSQQTAAQIAVREAERDAEQMRLAALVEDLASTLSAKMPLGASNPWWRSERYGNAFTAGPARIRVSETGQTVQLPDGYAYDLDVHFELSEDLPRVLKNFFESCGVAVTTFTLTESGGGVAVSGALPPPIVVSLTPGGGAPLQYRVATTDDGTVNVEFAGGLTGRVADGQGWQPVPATGMAVAGPYEDVLRFFRRVGSAPRLLAVEGPVTISPLLDTNGEYVVASITRLNVYLLPRATSETAADLYQSLIALGAAGGGAGGGPAGGPAMGGMPGMGPMGGGLGAMAAMGGAGGGAAPMGGGGGAMPQMTKGIAGGAG